jgi:uncharacterized membrane protein
VTAREKVVYVGDYGNTRYAFDAPESMVDQDSRKTTYMAKDAKHELAIMIEGRPCQDTMSGDLFDTTGTVILDGKTYRGCGKALH